LDDVDVVAVQIGRRPRGAIRVAARCPFELPLVVRTSPRLDAGEPFPTLYWLTCPAAARAASALESSGRMRSLNESLSREPALASAYREAHAAYVADRDAEGVLDGAPGVGGMPERVKCLHALLAHEYAAANPIGAIMRREIEPLSCPGPCVVDGDAGPAATPGHPHLGARR
jgi:hypothetical protein